MFWKLKRGLVCLGGLLLVAVLLVACGKSTPPASELPEASVGQAELSAKPADNELAAAGRTFALTRSEAEMVVLDWLEDHPFQFSANLESTSDDYATSHGEYYRFYLGIEKFGVAEILVNRETGEPFHLTSPGNSVFAPLDDWYNQYHRFFPEDDGFGWQTITTADGKKLEIPVDWTWSYADEDTGDIDILSEDGSIHLFAGYLIAGEIDEFLAETPHEPFTFANGIPGYLIETDEQMIWLNQDTRLSSGVSLNLNGDKTKYTNNQEIIKIIAASYRIER